MIYYDFKDYEGFKELFGIVQHGNGVKSRRNKILLALYKDREQLRNHIRANEYNSLSEQCEVYDHKCAMALGNSNKNYIRYCEIRERLFKRRLNETSCCDLLVPSLQKLKTELYCVLADYRNDKPGCRYTLNLNGREYPSDSFETDDMAGLCEDGTLNAIRYRNTEKQRVFKVKAGKMFNHILSCNTVTDALPEQIKRWLSEEWVAEWVEYARKNIGTTDFKLHVDENFSDIYDSDRCAGYDEDSNSFRSCMVDDVQWTFYRDAVKASAAYLTNQGGKIMARCIVFDEVHEIGSDKVWRLAERQYSRFGDPALQRQLIGALIQGGFIDGYKSVGASCSDNRKYVDNEGNSLESKKFYIDCHLEDGDTISYQDSFKWYDPEEERAYNYSSSYGTIDLSTTDETVSFNDHEHDCWSEYNQEYIDEDDAYYVDTRDDHFYGNQVCEACVWNRHSGRFSWETCFEGDCIKIDGDFYYAGDNASEPEGNGISRCPECDEYFIPDEGYYSDLTEESYCCESCMNDAEERWHADNGEIWSDYDGEWYDADEVIAVNRWLRWGGYYTREHISVESFNDLVESGEATEYLGSYYIDDILYDGEPLHAPQRAAA